MNHPPACNTYTVPLSPATLTHYRSPQDFKYGSSAPSYLSTSQAPPAKVKIKIAPSVNIASPPFPQGAPGRKVEQIADVIAEFGGRVVVDVKVDTCVLQHLEGRGGDWDQARVEGVVKETLRRVFEANKEKLALVRVTTADAETTLTLFPTIGHPSGASVLDTLLVTGKPTAILSRIELSLTWVAVESADAEGKQNSEAEQHFVLPQTSWLDHQPHPSQADHDMLPLDIPTSNVAQHRSDDAASTTAEVDGWMSKQLEVALHKVIKIHMIRRFPLIFDGALIQYARTLQPHRSLTASLSRFLTLAQKYARPAAALGASSILLLGQAQEAHVLAHVRAAASVPHRYKSHPGSEIVGGGKGKPKKKRKTDSQDSGDSPGTVAADIDPVDQRVNEHLERVALQMQAEEGQGVDMEKQVLDRLLRQGMGAIGRAKWEKGRMGMGRLAAHRIKLDRLEDQESTACAGLEQPTAIEEEHRAEDDMFSELGLDYEGDLDIDESGLDGDGKYECKGDVDAGEMGLLDWDDEDLGMDLDLDLDLDLDMSLDDSQGQSQDHTAGWLHHTSQTPHRSTSICTPDEEDPFLLHPDELLDLTPDTLQALQVHDEAEMGHAENHDDDARGELTKISSGVVSDVAHSADHPPDDLFQEYGWP